MDKDLDIFDEGDGLTTDIEDLDLD